MIDEKQLYLLLDELINLLESSQTINYGVKDKLKTRLLCAIILDRKEK